MEGFARCRITGHTGFSRVHSQPTRGPGYCQLKDPDTTTLQQLKSSAAGQSPFFLFSPPEAVEFTRTFVANADELSAAMASSSLSFEWAGMAQTLNSTHTPLSSSVLGLPYRILNISHKKELLRGLWVVTGLPGEATET